MNVNLNAAVSSLKYKKCVVLFDSISQFPYAHIKGEALSVQAYGKCGERVSSDIDILVPRDNINKIESALRADGFDSPVLSRSDKVLMRTQSHQVAPWSKEIKPFGYVTIDINFDVFWGEYNGKRIDINEFLSDAAETDIYGCKIKTLPPLKTMVQLILHHYKDMNSIFLLATKNSINYDMFKDVYHLLKSNPDEITTENLYSISIEYEIVPYVFYVLYYTNQIFQDKLLEQYVESFRTPEGIELLNLYGLAENERREWKTDFKTRLETENLYELIKDNLTKKDIEKIEINKKIF